MSVYYNENDPKAAAWLRELIKAELIPNGKIDERSITEVKPNDLDGFTQCHFFAGIGGWAYALSLAEWADRPVWTASCPCQPFSEAGLGLAEKDERHLWPVLYRLSRKRKPPIIIGEQVASKAALLWLDGVFADLEGAGYACGASDLCATGIGAPHIRQRLYWVAESKSQFNRRGQSRAQGRVKSTDGGTVGRLADAENRTRNGRGTVTRCGVSGMGNASDSGSQRHGRLNQKPDAAGREDSKRHPAASGFWDNFELIPCGDGKTRRIESGSFPLAHGIPGRVGLLRGYGNAIVPQVAAEFIKAITEIE